MDSSTAKGRAALFVATVQTKYMVQSKHQVRRFAAVSGTAAYSEYAEDPATSVWYVSPRMGVDADSTEAFELVQYTAGGVEQRITRASRKDAQLYSVNLVLTSEKPMVVSYTYRTLLLAHGHLLYLDVLSPTRGVDIQLDYGDVPIETVTTLDFIASSRPARIQTSSPSGPGRTVGVELGGWVFPKSGVVFVWVLEGERPSARAAQQRQQSHHLAD